MTYQILKSNWLAPKVCRLVVSAPHVVPHCGPGQFVIVRSRGDGERIPLTVAHCDRQREAITLIVQAVGATTEQLCQLQAGEYMADVAGPMGRQTEIATVGHVVIIGGGVGTAVIYPQAAALKAKGNYVSAIIGGRSRPYVILEKELAAICDVVYPCTDDGSYGFHGFVTQRLEKLIADNAAPPPKAASPQGQIPKSDGTSEQRNGPVKLVICAGPVPMMRAVARLTRSLGVATVASLNPVMVDGTGMCGGCRVVVDGQSKFACVDGPEFDAHKVDFAALMDRLTTYREQEQAALQRHRCKLAENS